MSADLDEMLRAAARGPSARPAPEHLWRRVRRRRLLLRAVGGAGLAGVAGLLALLVGMLPARTGTPVVAPVASTPGPPTAAAAETATPDPVEEPLRRWTVAGLAVALDVPASWTAPDGDPLARSGPSGHVRLAVDVGAVPVAELCAAEIARPGSPYGTHATVDMITVHGEAACRIAPTVGTAALAIVYVPLPSDVGRLGRSYLFVHADAEHLDGILRSLRFTQGE